MPRSSTRRDGTRTRLRWRCRRSRRDYPGRFAIMGAHDIIFSSNVRMAAPGVRRDKAALSSGCKPPPGDSLQPEAIGAVMEVTKWLKPSISVSRIGDSASVQAATRVNAEQASHGVVQVKSVIVRGHW